VIGDRGREAARQAKDTITQLSFPEVPISTREEKAKVSYLGRFGEYL